ncbi:MAG: archaeal proteasome endopeptidase complex subunit alpha [Candidatus Woesearchaeota archaeon]
MEPLNHQMMGYDRAVSMFSPDGRLLQVEYAKKTVKQGSTTIGIVCKDAVVLVAEKKHRSSLIIPESIDKIYEIDSHMAASFAGITSDARILMERAQVKAQQHKMSYDSSVDSIAIVKDISDLKQYTTQSGGIRPFGVALLLAGWDTDGPKLYMTDPTGIYFRYKAVAIGEYDDKCEELLTQEYKEDMSVENALKLGISILKRVSEEFDAKKIDCAYIEKGEFTRVSKDKLAKLV